MAADTLDFTFNTGLFEKGIDRVMGGFRNMENTAGAVSRGINKSLRRVAAVAAGLFGSFKLIQGALKNMPEVGQAFGIARDIFVKNLLFPLRKEILPLLQRMLDWVRDNRALFVRWGNTIANIFRSVVRGVRNVIEFIQRLSQRVAEFAGKIFGDQIRNIDDIFNLITFKLSVAIQFVTNLLSGIGSIFGSFIGGLGDIGPSLRGIVENLGEFLRIFATTNEQGNSFQNILESMAELFGQISGFVIRMTDKFLDGFVPAVRDIATPIQSMVDSFDSIFNSIAGTTEQLETWDTIFEGLGRIIGETVQFFLDSIAESLDRVAERIDFITGLFDQDRTLRERLFSGDREVSAGIFGRRARALHDSFPSNPTIPETLRIEGLQDGILRPDGSIVKTDPRDTLVAIKDPAESFRGLGASGGTRNFDVTVDLTGMNIVLQQGGQEQGQAFAQGLVEQIRFAWNQEFERFGA